MLLPFLRMLRMNWIGLEIVLHCDVIRCNTVQLTMSKLLVDYRPSLVIILLTLV